MYTLLLKKQIVCYAAEGSTNTTGCTPLKYTPLYQLLRAWENSRNVCDSTANLRFMTLVWYITNAKVQFKIINRSQKHSNTWCEDVTAN